MRGTKKDIQLTLFMGLKHLFEQYKSVFLKAKGIEGCFLLHFFFNEINFEEQIIFKQLIIII